MAANIQAYPTSGLIVTGTTGSHALNLALLCGVAAGSVIVPVAVKSDGSLVISGA